MFRIQTIFIIFFRFASAGEISISNHPSQQRYVDENKEKVALMCNSTKFDPGKLEWKDLPPCDKKIGAVKSSKTLSCDQGVCTATLITPKHVLTAGHCLDGDVCPTTNFLFGVYDTSSSIDREKVRKCKAVTARKNAGKLDYAILELDEPVDFVEPAMSYRRSGTPDTKGLYVSYGHPQGRAMHATRGSLGQETDRSNPWNPFADELLTSESTLIATQGQSGSSLFSKTLLEGILIEGTTKARMNKQKNCVDYSPITTKSSTEILSIKTILSDSGFRPELYYQRRPSTNRIDGTR